METSLAQTAKIPAIISAEITTVTSVPAYTVGTTTTKSSWVKSAVLLSKLRQRRGEFSRYDLGENFKNDRVYTPPVFLAVADPKPPLLKPRVRRGQNPLIRASEAWYREWLRRDWDAAFEFLKNADLDNEPNQPVIRIAD